MKIYFSTYVLIFSVFISNSALAYKTPINKIYYETGRIDFIIIDTTGSDKPATKKEQQADYLTEIWSHADDMKPKELVKFMEGLITELRQKQANKNLKIQLDAIKALHEQFENEIPGFGGNQPNVCEWKDRLASTISALAPDSEIAEYEITSGVSIG
ncbi:MAG TPA: hypothetical protein PLR06_11685, partial [Cyclobacteriaceae bacterium]|nr:hypothetical protein [Cyclobacteriaceae bacterium]